VNADSQIHSAADLIGKRVAVPGFGATVDILAKAWSRSNNVDYKKINWVELPFPQMSDALKAHQVDAVVAVNPFLARMLDAKVGYSLGEINGMVPDGTLPVVLISTRQWAAENRDSVQALRAALDDATAYIDDAAHADSVRQSIAKWTQLPPAAAATLPIALNVDGHAKPQGLKFWIDVLREQGLIKGNPDPASLIAP